MYNYSKHAQTLINKGIENIKEYVVMARSSRQSKILELISTKDIGSQDELVAYLKAADFDITQATISRDIKELGLIKILGAEGKYKYALMDNGEQTVSNKNISLFRESVISIKVAQNLCVIKTVKGLAFGICSMIDKLNVEDNMGTVCGDDTVMIIFPDSQCSNKASKTLQSMIR